MRVTQIISLSPAPLVTLLFVFYGVLYCEITKARSHFSNKLLILPTYLVFSIHLKDLKNQLVPYTALNFKS